MDVLISAEMADFASRISVSLPFDSSLVCFADFLAATFFVSCQPEVSCTIIIGYLIMSH